LNNEARAIEYKNDNKVRSKKGKGRDKLSIQGVKEIT
jgi:hypothetical protein